MPKITKNSNLAPYMELASLESISPKESDIEKVNKFTVAPLTDEDVRIYQALLIDDQVTRNSTHYPADFQKAILSLPAGEGNFVGAPILFGDDKDHKEAASAQVGRIFDAWQVTDKAGHIGVMAKFYVPKESYEALIGKIDSGVLKEVSISTKVEMPICSICHQDIRTCGHTMGKEGCHVSMTGKGFCAEVSLVAVPGSSQAKILNAQSAAKYSPLEMMESVRNLIREELAKFKEVESPMSRMKKTWDSIRKVNSDIAAEGVASNKQAAVAALKAGKVPTAIEGAAQAGSAAIGGHRFGKEPWTGPNPKLIDAAQKATVGAGDLASGVVSGATSVAQGAGAGGAIGAAKGAIKGGAIPGAVAGAGKGITGAISGVVKKFAATPGLKTFGANLGAGLAAFAVWEGGRALINKMRNKKQPKESLATDTYKEGMMTDFLKKIKPDSVTQSMSAAAPGIKTAVSKVGGALGAAAKFTIPRSIPGIVAYSALGTAVSMGVSSLINKFTAKKTERDEEKRARQVTMRGAESLHSYKEEFNDEEHNLMTELGFSIGDVETATDEEMDELISLLQELNTNIQSKSTLSEDDKMILMHFGVDESEIQDWTPEDVDELLATFEDETGFKLEMPAPEVKATEGFSPLTFAAGALVGSLLYKAHKAKAEKEGRQDVPPVIINIQGPSQSVAQSPISQQTVVNPWRPIMSYRMSLNVNDMFRESENSLKFTPDELTFLMAIGIDAKEASELDISVLNQLIALLEGHKAQIEGTPDAPGLIPVEEPVVKSTESLETTPVVAELDTLLNMEAKIDEAYSTIIMLAGKYGIEPVSFDNTLINRDDKYSVADNYFNKLHSLDMTLRSIESKLGITTENISDYEDKGDNRVKVAYISQKLDNVMKRTYTLKGRVGMEDASKLELVNEAIRAGVLAGTIAVGTQDDAERLFRNMSVAEIKKTTEAFTEKAKTAFWSVKEVHTETVNKPKSDRELASAITNSRRK